MVSNALSPYAAVRLPRKFHQMLENFAWYQKEDKKLSTIRAKIKAGPLLGLSKKKRGRILLTMCTEALVFVEAYIEAFGHFRDHSEV